MITLVRLSGGAGAPPAPPARAWAQGPPVGADPPPMGADPPVGVAGEEKVNILAPELFLIDFISF